MAIKRCLHRTITVRTERDRCSWVECCGCRKVGPRKHSYMLALIAFAVQSVNQHPRRKRLDALRAAGALVYRLDEPCDLLVWYRERWMTLEVKTPYGKAGRERLDKRQEAQQTFLRLTATPIVKSPMDALRAIGAAI